jgi:hypothetical protein
VNFGSQAADYSDAKKTFDIGFWQAYLPSVAITTSCACHRRHTQGLGLAGWGVRRSNRSDLNVGDGDNGLENDIQRTLPERPAEALTGEFSPPLVVQK